MLHIAPSNSIGSCITKLCFFVGGNEDIFSQLLDYDLNNEVEIVAAGAVRKIPLACYTSLLLTQLDHSLPELLDRGLALLKVVQDAGRMDHVLEILMKHYASADVRPFMH